MSFHTRLSTLQSQMELPLGPTTVVFRPADPAGLPDLGTDVHCVQSFVPNADRLSASGLTLVERPDPGHYDTAVVCLSRARDENRANIARAWRALTPGGLLLVDGAKTDGIDSLAREIGKRLDHLESHSKAHGKLLHAYRDSFDPFGDWAGLGDPRQIDGGFWTCAGIFSSDGVDPGSQLLAETLPTGLSGKAADFGAGWGWLSHSILGTNPDISSMTLIEAEARALDCAKRNVSDRRARFVLADATQAEGDFDLIIMNPPFHTGRKPDASLGQAFIKAAARSLRPKGKLFVVANRQLPYEATLETHFASTSQRAQKGAFKVLEARNPRRAPKGAR